MTQAAKFDIGSAVVIQTQSKGSYRTNIFKAVVVKETKKEVQLARTADGKAAYVINKETGKGRCLDSYNPVRVTLMDEAALVEDQNSSIRQKIRYAEQRIYHLECDKAELLKKIEAELAGIETLKAQIK